MLETIANMLIVSFFWLIFSLPIFTIVASSAALFHTVSKIIFGQGRGNGVFKDFFASYKLNLISGIKLSAIMVVAGLFVAEGLWTGYQIYKINIWGLLYMILGILITFVVITAFIHIPPVLSKFDAPVSSIIRMAVYFALKKPFRSIIFTLLIVLMYLFVTSFPLALMIVPALYTDLIRPYLEKDMDLFIKENGLEEKAEEIAEEEITEVVNESLSDLDERFANDRKKGKK